jgi:3-oxoacyl-[acyl-carrier protein] reductase
MSDKRVAIITGGGSGVGQATTEALARKGFRIAILDIDEAAAHKQARALADAGFEAHAARTDVADDAQVGAAVAGVLSRWGRADALVNNAGMPQANLPFEEVTAEIWTQVLNVNLMSIVNLARYVVPSMRARRAGAIVNVTSVSGIRARPGMSAYCAAKAAAVSLTETLALELAEHGIRVNSVAPGSLETPMFARFLRDGETWTQAMERYLPQIPVHRLGQPQEIADTIAWIAADAPGFMTGQVIAVDGGRSL